jgi:hypothetical protein
MKHPKYGVSSWMPSVLFLDFARTPARGGLPYLVAEMVLGATVSTSDPERIRFDCHQ